MKESYLKPTAEWVEFESERIMLSLYGEGGDLGGDLSGDDGVGGDEGWD